MVAVNGVRIYEGESPEEIKHQCAARIERLEKQCAAFVPELALEKARRTEINILQAVIDVIEPRTVTP